MKVTLNPLPVGILFGTVCSLLIAPMPATARTLRVWECSPNPTPPYTNWTTAAHTIQDAVDTAHPGDTVLVTNGIYASGGRTVTETLTNRVVIDKRIRVRSVNGPGVTTIQGSEAPGGGNGDGAVRCAYLGSRAFLSGFTLVDGHTRTNGYLFDQQSGGGVCCAGPAVVTNCILINNSAAFCGGGAYHGTFYDCVFVTNSAPSGGALIEAVARQCTMTGNHADVAGGAAYDGTLENCVISHNTSGSHAGGVFGGSLRRGTLVFNSAVYGGGAVGTALYNCLVISNSASFNGGGAAEATLCNCTVVGNSAVSDGGGVYGIEIYNTISWFNTPNNYNSIFAHYSCAEPTPPHGNNNIGSYPRFMDPAAGDFRLAWNSPCIDAGMNLGRRVTDDLLGVKRPCDGNLDSRAAFDIGAYEFCDIDQMVPCEGPASGGRWKNHVAYVIARFRVILSLRIRGVLTATEANDLLQQAIQSDCGSRVSTSTRTTWTRSSSR